MRLGITRAQSQLNHLQNEASHRGVELVSLPIITTEAIKFDWPLEIETSGTTWLIFTSSNAVRYFFEQLEKADLSLPQTIKIAAVGKKTADLIKKIGLEVSFVPSDTYGELLFTEFIDQQSKAGDAVIFARGKIVNFEPSELLSGAKVGYYPVVCYETLKKELPSERVGKFVVNDYILFTAPSAVNAYHDQHGQPVAKPIALGRSTATAMNESGWYGFVTMKNADIDTVLEYL